MNSKKSTPNLFQSKVSWCTGTGSFWSELELDHIQKNKIGRSRLSCAVEIQLGQNRLISLFDTGSEYCVMSQEMAEELEAGGYLEWLDLFTQHHSMVARGQKAQFAKCNLSFLARHWGSDLALQDVTILVPAVWNQLLVIGVKTCIERINFAMEMESQDQKIRGEGIFYFAEQRS